MKAFDSMWAKDCLNDLYDVGCVYDKLALLEMGTKKARVAIKTSKGITDRISIKNIIMQGTVAAGIKCTASIDKLSKYSYENKPFLYIYKGVEVPPLCMVDDILSISKCLQQSIAMNATVNSFVEIWRLKLKQSKCSAIHVGKSNQCSDWRVHKDKNG